MKIPRLISYKCWVPRLFVLDDHIYEVGDLRNG